MKRQIEKTSKDSLAVYYELRFKIPIGTMLTTKEYDKAEDKLNEYIINILKKRTKPIKHKRIILPEKDDKK